MKNYEDLGGSYPARPTASTDSNLLDVHNSSKDTQPHSLICCTISISADVIPEDLFSTVREVQGALNSIKVRKSPGPDGIPNVLLKSFSFELAPVICELYNSSLREGFIPPLLKSACVRPLPKKRPAQSVNNDIRPISLTCQISKVMEGLTLSRLAPSVLVDLAIDAKQFTTPG